MKKKIRLNYRDEMDFIATQVEEIRNESLRREVEHRLRWFLGKAQRNRYAYYFLSAFTIVAGAAIPVLNGFGGGEAPSLTKILVSVLAALSSIAAGLCALFNCRETWSRNRKYAEQLKRDCLKYSLEKSGSQLTDAEITLWSRLLDITTDELQAWLEQQKKTIKQ